MELIDREELLRRLDKMINFERRQVKLTDAWNTLLRARDAVLECKVVDAEPVKHGKWIESKEHIYIADGSCKEWTNFYCSNCDAPTSDPRDYCPWCGAKMYFAEGE